jgi:hypothetical protein
MAHRNLHRRENDADRLCGILGIHVARARRPLALSEVDSRDGALCPSQAQGLLDQLGHRIRENRYVSSARKQSAFNSSGSAGIFSGRSCLPGLFVLLNSFGSRARTAPCLDVSAAQCNCVGRCGSSSAAKHSQIELSRGCANRGVGGFPAQHPLCCSDLVEARGIITLPSGARTRRCRFA